MQPVVLATVLAFAAAASDGARADDAPELAASATAGPPQRLGYGLELQQQMRTAAWRTPLGLAATAGPVPVLVMGVSVRTGGRSRLAWQTPLAATERGTAAGTTGAGERPGDVQLAWTLRSRDPALAALRGSSFKYALSGQTVVTLKPRRSKLSVALQHEW